MKIALVSPSIYMSLKKYGDMIFAPRDLVVSLADGLVDNGHDVHLFTAPGLKTKATVIPGDEDLIIHEYIEDKLKNEPGERLKWGSFYNRKEHYETDLVAQCYRMALEKKFDIVHCYHDRITHYFDETTGFPTVYTLHDPVPQAKEALQYWFLKKFRHHNYVSISNAYRRNNSIDLHYVATVYHGIDTKHYSFMRSAGKYLAFIGRMVPEKGISDAIDASTVVQIPLRLATSSLRENNPGSYYHDVIEPKLQVNKQVSLVGFMNGSEKTSYLGNAQCLLFPIKWEEPFGMVMIEAMACGTPVIAYNRGSVAEVVKDGVTGFIIDPDAVDRPGRGSWIIKKQGVEGLVEAIKRIGQIDRRSCRKQVEDHFTVEKMVEGYERVYTKVLTSKG